jgi:hypothetical protein
MLRNVLPNKAGSKTTTKGVLLELADRDAPDDAAVGSSSTGSAYEEQDMQDTLPEPAIASVITQVSAEDAAAEVGPTSAPAASQPPRTWKEKLRCEGIL